MFVVDLQVFVALFFNSCIRSFSSAPYSCPPKANFLQFSFVTCQPIFAYNHIIIG